MFDTKKILDDKTTLAAFISFLVLGLLAFLLLIKFDLGNFNRLNRTIRETKNNIDTLENLVEYKAYIGRFNERFAEKRTSGWLMEVLAELGKSESITFSKIKPIQSRSAVGYKIISVEGAGIAPYIDIFRLLRDIESYGSYIFVERLNITPAVSYQRGPNRNMPDMSAPSNMPAGGKLMNKEADASLLEMTNVNITISSIGTEI